MKTPTTLRFALIASALAFAVACGSSSSTPTTPTPQGATAVSIVTNARTLTTTAYAPNPVTISAGTMVTWTNNDTIAHNTTSDTGVFSSGSMAAGAQYSYTFANKGTFPYHCTIHPGMVGTVVVQ